MLKECCAIFCEGPYPWATAPIIIGNEGMDERTVRVVEESGEEVGLEGERIRGGKGCEGGVQG